MRFVEPYMKEALKNHVLEVVLDSEKIQAYYLKEPGQGRMMSTLILFTPEGIVLQGDLTPGRFGNVSAYKYGRAWFAGFLSEDYLCEKFLPKVYVPEKALAACKRGVLEGRRAGGLTKEKALDLWIDLTAFSEYFLSERNAYDFWTDELLNDGCDAYFYGYEPDEAGWLCAIQQRFAETWEARTTSPEGVVA